MARANVVTAITTIFLCLAPSACEGDVAIFTSRLPALGDAGPAQPPGTRAPAAPGSVPPGVSPAAPVGSSRPVPSDEPSSSDAGELATGSDASAAPAVPSVIVVGGPAVALPRLGVDGGEPRLGVCQGGVVIGARTTANPTEEVFGQRLTFIEPICGKVQQGPDPSGDSPGALSVTRDDSMVAWAETDGFMGAPSTEVPDARLLWVLQPATVCPEGAPVVVGLSGEYDPVAPDVPDTAAIRSLVIECAPLIVAPNGIDIAASGSNHLLLSNADSFTAAGAATYRSACGGGAVTTQIQVHAGFWLDGFVLGCSSLRLE